MNMLALTAYILSYLTVLAGTLSVAFILSLVNGSGGGKINFSDSAFVGAIGRFHVEISIALALLWVAYTIYKYNYFSVHLGLFAVSSVVAAVTPFFFFASIYALDYGVFYYYQAPRLYAELVTKRVSDFALREEQHKPYDAAEAISFLYEIRTMYNHSHSEEHIKEMYDMVERAIDKNLLDPKRVVGDENVLLRGQSFCSVLKKTSNESTGAESDFYARISAIAHCS